jgi:Flp pilus assembly protein TadD
MGVSLASPPFSRYGLVAVVLGLAVGVFATSCTMSAAKRLEKQNRHAIKCAKKGFWNEAAFHWQALRETKPADPTFLNNLAVAAMARGDYNQALVLLGEGLALAPNTGALQENKQNLRDFLEKERKRVRRAAGDEVEAEDGLQTSTGEEDEP